MKNSILAITAFMAVVLASSCKKGPGEGGNSTIKGYISVIQYDAFFIDTLGIYPGRDEEVHIIYGDDASYGDRIRSGHDGVFEFKYLRPGDYKVYVYSDTVKYHTDSFGKPVVLRSIEITEKDQVVDAGTFTIRKN